MLRYDVLRAVFVFWCATVCAGGTGKEPGEQHAEQQIRSRVEAALRMRQAGDPAGARATLEALLVEHPDLAPARWQLGYIQTGNQWLKYDRVVHEPNRWPELHQYQLEREKLNDNFRDHLFLADGCREHGLADEERAHLTRAVHHNRTFEEGHARLGNVLIGGFWVSPQQLNQSTSEWETAQLKAKQWGDRIASLYRVLATQKMQSPKWNLAKVQLFEIRTPDAIPAVETVFATENEASSLMFVDWVSRIESVEASRSLARQSVFHPQASVRIASQRHLKSRRREEYVPELLSGMETVQQEFDIQVQVFPWLLFTASTKSKYIGQNGELTSVVQETYFPSETNELVQDVNGRRIVVRPVTQVIANAVNPQTERIVREMLEQVRSSMARNLTQEAEDEFRTSRILKSLEEATEVTGNRSAEDWWAWWRKYNDAQLTHGRVKLEDRYQKLWYVDERSVVQVNRINTGASCFAAGTLVETEHGLRRIEAIEIGDRVLAMGIESGELQFKPVFDITTRENAPILKLWTGSNSPITCSKGHPFWVIGQGWRMAHELQPGDEVYSLEGAETVLSVEELGKEPVFNLVVADFSTYFAGEQRLLTHDVTPRRATDMVIPGLRKEFK